MNAIHPAALRAAISKHLGLTPSDDVLQSIFDEIVRTDGSAEVALEAATPKTYFYMLFLSAPGLLAKYGTRNVFVELSAPIEYESDLNALSRQFSEKLRVPDVSIESWSSLRGPSRPNNAMAAIITRNADGSIS